MCVDALIALCALRDRLVLGRVHAVYRFGLAAFITGQVLVVLLQRSSWWLELSASLFV